MKMMLGLEAGDSAISFGKNKVIAVSAAKKAIGLRFINVESSIQVGFE